MEERFSAQMAVDDYVARHNISIKDIGVAPVAVMSWSERVIETFAETVGAQLSEHGLYGPLYKLYTGTVQGQEVCFAHAPVGAPTTVALMEEMIACGARVFLGLGWAGSLQPFAPVGTMLIPADCIREEGTSFHYLSDDTVVSPNERLVERLQSAVQIEGGTVLHGPHWTTDAPYRELCSKIDAYRQRGILGVDMETSAMYALGQFRGVQVCNLLVVSDELWREWRPAFGTPELREATRFAFRVMLKCLEQGFDI